MRVCIAGKYEIAVRGLEYALAHLGTDRVLACLNGNDDGVSRWQPSLRRFANEWGVQVVSLTDLYEHDDLVFISLEFDRIDSTGFCSGAIDYSTLTSPNCPPTRDCTQLPGRSSTAKHSLA